MLCVLVDAFRHDYLEAHRTPFLTRLAKNGMARMRPILGYSDSIRATIFTGAYPDEHGYWMEYCFRPEQSPFRTFERLAPLDRFPSDFIQRGLKFALSQTIVRRVAARRGYSHLSLRHIPFRGAGQFDWTLRDSMTTPDALGFPTFFDQLTEAGLPSAYLDSARDGTRGVLRELERLPAETRLVFVYLHHIDMASHVLGLDSRIFSRVVTRTDSLVEKVVATFSRRFGPTQPLVFSDHGMSRVDRIVSYPRLWTHLAFPAGFCFALDATLVRLWFHDEDPGLRQEVRSIVSSAAPGRFLDPPELAELHLDFGHRLYGDEIYLLDPGAAIFPNFHSMLKPKAMHAYHPDDPDQQGIFIAPPGAATGETAELVDVTQLCREVTGLERQRDGVSVSGH